MPRTTTQTDFLNGIPIETWRELYDAADALFKLKPWSWMYDDQLFVVQDPNSGTPGYCCIMGALGEHLALAVYPGPAGLATYLRARSQPATDPLRQLCLQVSFEDRDLISPAERNIIKMLGRKYRGAMTWPHLASYHPGYLPWHLEPDEARVLLVAIQQALQVTPRLRDNPQAFDPPRPGTLLTRALRDGTWQDQWTAPGPLPPETRLVPRYNPSWLAALQAQGKARSGAWQVGVTVLDAAINERGQRPYLASLFLVVDAASGLILASNVLGPEGRVEAMARMLAQAVDQAPHQPERFEVNDPDAAAVVTPLAEPLGIPVVSKPRLTALERTLRSMGRLHGMIGG